MWLVDNCNRGWAFIHYEGIRLSIKYMNTFVWYITTFTLYRYYFLSCMTLNMSSITHICKTSPRTYFICKKHLTINIYNISELIPIPKYKSINKNKEKLIKIDEKQNYLRANWCPNVIAATWEWSSTSFEETHSTVNIIERWAAQVVNPTTVQCTAVRSPGVHLRSERSDTRTTLGVGRHLAESSWASQKIHARWEGFLHLVASDARLPIVYQHQCHHDHDHSTGLLARFHSSFEYEIFEFWFIS